MANGNFAGGTGTEQDPYLIEDAFDLDAVRNDLSAHYKLINNIDLDVAPFNEGEGWVPIGDNSTDSNDSRFLGYFDGDNKVIFNLFINRPSSDYQGLFGHTNGSTIENVGIENIDITSTNNTGGLVGYNYNSSVIENSYSTGSVTGNNRYMGGLVGRSYNSSIVNSYFTGSVTGVGYTGGLVGYNYNSSVVNSYSTGSVTGSGDYYTGGLVGYTYGSSIVNSYSTGSVTGTSNTGGLVGYSSRTSVVNSYWDKEASGYTTSSGGTGLTTQEMQTAQTFIDAGWHEEVTEDGIPVWMLQDGEYPRLWFEYDPLCLVEHNSSLYTYNEGFQLLDTSEINHLTIQEFGFELSEMQNIPPSDWEYFTSGKLKIVCLDGLSFYNEFILETETEPFYLTDIIGKDFDLLLYTNDEEADENTHQLTVSSSYSPLDELEGEFEVLVWTNEEMGEYQDTLDFEKDEELEDGSIYSVAIDLDKFGKEIVSIE